MRTNPRAEVAARRALRGARRHRAARAALLAGALLAAAPLLADLDPPGPPAFQEVIWLTRIQVFDDMDAFGSGELFLRHQVDQPGHETSIGHLIGPSGPYDVDAPPPTLFPAAQPVVIYNHLNCWPPERPFGIRLVLFDDDVTGLDLSLLNAGEWKLVGPGLVGNGEFLYQYMVGIFPVDPQISRYCAGEGEIPDDLEPPPPPEEPGYGTDDPDELLPPPEPEPGTEPAPEPEPEVVPPGNDPSAFVPEPKPLLRRADAALAVGLLAGLLLGMSIVALLRRHERRAK